MRRSFRAMRSRGVGRRLAAVLVAALALVLAGCGGDEGEPQPSGSGAGSSSSSAPASPAAPSPSGSASIDEQALVDEAIAALTEYLALANEIENNGGEGWEALEPWWGTDSVGESGRSHFTTFREWGWRTEGATVVVNAGGHVTDVSTRTVQLSYCLDPTGVRAVDADGEPVEGAATRPFVAEADVTLAQEQPQLLRIRNHRDTPC